MGLSWNKQLSIANTIVDSEHKHLISLTNQVERAMQAAMEQRDDSPLLHAFELLEHELCRHFRNEEKIAQAVNFPFEQHQQAQRHMLRELRYLKSELLTKDCIWTKAALEHFSLFLEEWMLEHITHIDMPMKAVLQGYDYNYWPDWETTAACNEAEPLAPIRRVQAANSLPTAYATT